MPWETIVKRRRDWRVVPNLQDYAQARGSFSWLEARRELEGLPGGPGLNIAHEAVDRHANGPFSAHLAACLWHAREAQDYVPVIKAREMGFPK